METSCTLPLRCVFCFFYSYSSFPPFFCVSLFSLFVIVENQLNKIKAGTFDELIFPPWYMLILTGKTMEITS